MAFVSNYLNSEPTQESASDLIRHIRKICGRLQTLSLNRRIEACRAILPRTQVIDMAILGQFKAGESSFLNSLIGKPIFAVGLTPVTTAITRLQFGKIERAHVNHFDGQQTQMDTSASPRPSGKPRTFAVRWKA